ncbi:hypothetical protein ACFO0N_13605 [Halobium salinum]|uniref:Integral membrane protein n=1 Tax=Halobium salinum TaxID=1364940 RepID=A0ABD5PDH1_9EURY|nr:hypothetical protein [Halobium salinum]
MVPLQPLLLPVLVALGVGCLALGVASFVGWVYLDARAHGRSSRSAVAWAVVALFGPMTLVYLLLVRPRAGPREYPPTRRERGTLAFALASVGAMVLGATLSPPDPLTQVLYLTAFLLVTLPVAALAVSGTVRRRLGEALR